MLYSQFIPASDTQSPLTLIWLHGLLGNRRDWQPCIDALPAYNHLCIDLPGHGSSQWLHCDSLTDCCQQIVQAAQQRLEPQQKVVIVGYSLGGRIAMHGLANGVWDAFNLQGVVVEGGNFGLQDEQQKQQRHVNDENWASRFAQEPLDEVLHDWYLQPVFASLTPQQRQAMVLRRSVNLGGAIARMLMATSLATQDNLLPRLTPHAAHMHYICGANDGRFTTLAKQSGLSYTALQDAGHNVHYEQPVQFAAIVADMCTSWLNDQ